MDLTYTARLVQWLGTVGQKALVQNTNKNAINIKNFPFIYLPPFSSAIVIVVVIVSITVVIVVVVMVCVTTILKT